MRRLFRIVFLYAVCFQAGAQKITFNNATGSHLPEVAQKARNSMDAKVGDIDGDGDLDLVVAIEFYKNVILLNQGSGTFSDGSALLPDIRGEEDPKPYPYYPYHDTEDIALADFDNDGDLDLVFVTEDDQVNEFYLNRGDGAFEDNTTAFPATGVSNGVLAGDFDNDGWTDLILGNNGQNIYLKNAKGTFIDQTSERLPKREDITQDLQAVDFDGDGDLDIIVANEKGNVFLMNNGEGIFMDETAKYFSDTDLMDETREAVFCDIDGDGDYDVYFANVYMFQRKDPEQRLLINENNRAFFNQTRERLGFTKEYSILDANFADLDRDGDQDLLLLTHQGPKLFQNNGTGFFEDITLSAFGNLQGDGVDSEIADFNGDGKPDIFIACFRGSDILLLQANPNPQ